mgnify:CR=1 FL=1
MTKKAQSWSVDIMLAVVLFIGAFMLFYVFIYGDSGDNAAQLNKEASVIISQVSSDESPVKVVDGNDINISKIAQLRNMSYDELKRRLRAEKDFCIYFEDENGNIVLVNGSYGVGSKDINVSGTPCESG